MESNEELTKKQKFITSTISSLGMIGVYTSGVNLAKENLEYHNPIFISTIIITYISPHLLYTATTYMIKKYKSNKKIKK